MDPLCGRVFSHPNQCPTSSISKVVIGHVLSGKEHIISIGPHNRVFFLIKGDISTFLVLCSSCDLSQDVR